MLPVEATLAAVRAALAPRFDTRLCASRPVENHPSTPRYTGRAPPGHGRFFFPHSTREADLPAQRAPAEAQARLPRPDVHPGRPRDPQAAPREGPQAPLGLTPLDARVQRRHRLSRSRDFDAVYRHGRSVSTRFLVLYWFPREDDGDGPRLGLAVPKAVGAGGRPQPDEAAAARGLARAPRRRCRRTRTTCSSCARASPRRSTRAASTGSASASTRCSGRPRREVACARRPTSASASSTRAAGRFGAALARLVQVPPDAARSTRSTRCASTGSCAARSSPAGGCCAATRGATAASTTRATRGSSDDRSLAHPRPRSRTSSATSSSGSARTARSGCRGPGRSSR